MSETELAQVSPLTVTSGSPAMRAFTLTKGQLEAHRELARVLRDPTTPWGSLIVFEGLPGAGKDEVINYARTVGGHPADIGWVGDRRLVAATVQNWGEKPYVISRLPGAHEQIEHDLAKELNGRAVIGIPVRGFTAREFQERLGDMPPEIARTLELHGFGSTRLTSLFYENPGISQEELRNKSLHYLASALVPSLYPSRQMEGPVKFGSPQVWMDDATLKVKLMNLSPCRDRDAVAGVVDDLCDRVKAVEANRGHIMRLSTLAVNLAVAGYPVSQSVLDRYGDFVKRDDPEPCMLITGFNATEAHRAQVEHAILALYTKLIPNTMLNGKLKMVIKSGMAWYPEPNVQFDVFGNNYIGGVRNAPSEFEGIFTHPSRLNWCAGKDHRSLCGSAGRNIGRSEGRGKWIFQATLGEHFLDVKAFGTALIVEAVLSNLRLPYIATMYGNTRAEDARADYLVRDGKSTLLPTHALLGSSSAA